MRTLRPNASAAGLLVGLAAVAVLVPQNLVAKGEGSLGLDLMVSLRHGGELELVTENPVINARRLLAGRRATGRAELRNISPLALEARFTASPSSRELLRVLRVEVREGGHTVVRGTLAELRRARHAPVVIASGRSARLSVRAWLPRGAAAAKAAGLLEDLAIDVATRPAGGRR